MINFVLFVFSIIFGSVCSIYLWERLQLLAFDNPDRFEYVVSIGIMFGISLVITGRTILTNTIFLEILGAFFLGTILVIAQLLDNKPVSIE